MAYFEVWSEGYIATGEEARPAFEGSAEARTFEEACNKVCSAFDYYDPKTNRLWGMGLYPSREAAYKEGLFSGVR